MFPKSASYVPKLGTLLLHYPTKIMKEIMVKYFRGSSDDLAVKMLVLENFINITTIAMHLFGEPSDRAALLVKDFFDDMSYMNLSHECVHKNIVELL